MVEIFGEEEADEQDTNDGAVRAKLLERTPTKEQPRTKVLKLKNLDVALGIKVGLSKEEEEVDQDVVMKDKGSIEK